MERVSEAVLMHNMDYMAQFEDGFFDLACVDPPYKISSQQKRGVGSRIDKSGKMNLWNNETPRPEYFKELFRVSKNQIIFGANNYEGLPKTEYFLIWNKEQSVDNFASLEYAWVSMGIGIPAKMFTYSIHKHNSNKGDKIHPTMKPISLYDWIYKKYLPAGGKVLDTHLGSGSNRIAADKAGNIDFYSCELDEEYFNDQEKRWRNYKSQLTLF